MGGEVGDCGSGSQHHVHNPGYNVYNQITELLMALCNHINTKEQYLSIFQKEMDIFSSIPGCSSLVEFCNTKIRADFMDLSMMNNLLGKIVSLVENFKPKPKLCILAERNAIPYEVKLSKSITLDLRKSDTTKSVDLETCVQKRKIDIEHSLCDPKRIKVVADHNGIEHEKNPSAY